MVIFTGFKDSKIPMDTTKKLVTYFKDTIVYKFSIFGRLLDIDGLFVLDDDINFAGEMVAPSSIFNDVKKCYKGNMLEGIVNSYLKTIYEDLNPYLKFNGSILTVLHDVSTVEELSIVLDNYLLEKFKKLNHTLTIIVADEAENTLKKTITELESPFTIVKEKDIDSYFKKCISEQILP